MEHSVLVQSFADAATALSPKGHLIVVRRARAYLEAGDLTGALGFLARAQEAMGAGETAVSALAGSLETFAQGGGDWARLVTDPEWVEVAAQASRLTRFVDGAAAPGHLQGLVDGLARHQKALAASDPLPSAPPRQVAPQVLPPLPRPAAATAPSVEVPRAPSAPIAYIFAGGGRRSKAAVEIPIELDERPLDLDDEETPAIAGPFAREDAPAPVSAAAGPRTISSGPMVIPELHAPPEMKPPPAPQTSDGRGGIVAAVVVLVLATAAAGAWFLLK